MDATDYNQFILIIKQHNFDILAKYNIIIKDKSELKLDNISGETLKNVFEIIRGELTTYFSSIYHKPISIVHIFEFLSNLIKSTKDVEVLGNSLAYLNRGVCYKTITTTNCLSSIISAIVGSYFIMNVEVIHGEELKNKIIEHFQKNITHYLECNCEQEQLDVDIYNDFTIILKSSMDENNKFRDLWLQSKYKTKDLYNLFLTLRSDFINKYSLPNNFTFTNYYLDGLQKQIKNKTDQEIIEFLGDILIYWRSIGRYTTQLGDYNTELKGALAGSGIGPLFWQFTLQNFKHLYEKLETYVNTKENRTLVSIK